MSCQRVPLIGRADRKNLLRATARGSGIAPGRRWPTGSGSVNSHRSTSESPSFCSVEKSAVRLLCAVPGTYSNRVVRLSISTTCLIAWSPRLSKRIVKSTDVARLGGLGRSDLDHPQARMIRLVDAERDLRLLVAR